MGRFHPNIMHYLCDALGCGFNVCYTLVKWPSPILIICLIQTVHMFCDYIDTCEWSRKLLTPTVQYIICGWVRSHHLYLSIQAFYMLMCKLLKTHWNCTVTPIVLSFLILYMVDKWDYGFIWRSLVSAVGADVWRTPPDYKSCRHMSDFSVLEDMCLGGTFEKTSNKR